MATLTPMSRDEMRHLKAQADEAARVQLVEQHVRSMYHLAIQIARSSTKTQYIYDVGQHSHVSPFISNNIDDILCGLQDLFPDCSVEFKSVTMAMGPDRQIHDISTLDEKALIFIGNRQVKQCIIIDWS
jgi:hypothetical protein